MTLRFALALCISVAAFARLGAQTTYFYGGDDIPAGPAYAAWFTTVGPGHPTGSYFIGTTWSSNGSVLTMQTQHPSDYTGATSQGIWFGRTDGYGDPSSFSLANTAGGNLIDARIALGAASSEWSLYWYDASGYGASIYWLNNGFTYSLQSGSVFVPLADMTSFHTYTSHIQNGIVSYFLDGSLIGTGAAAMGLSNFLLLGDGSATDVSGYGTLRVDSLSITTNSGALSASAIPEPGDFALLAAGMALVGTVIVRRRRAVAPPRVA